MNVKQLKALLACFDDNLEIAFKMSQLVDDKGKDCTPNAWYSAVFNDLELTYWGSNFHLVFHGKFPETTNEPNRGIILSISLPWNDPSTTPKPPVGK